METGRGDEFFRMLKRKGEPGLGEHLRSFLQKGNALGEKVDQDKGICCA